MSGALRTVSSAYRSTLGRIGLLAPRRRPHADRASASGRRGRRLFRKYVLLLVGLVGLVLLVDTGLHFWFSYSEDKAAALGVQQEMAKSAARRIEEFIDEIEHQLGWTTAPQWAAAPVEQRQFDFVRLLRQAPAITELIQLDDNGKEQLRVSRLAMDVVGSGKDYSQEPSFTEAKKHRVWFSAVYFRKESEPYLTLSMAQAGHNAGVTIAEVNLKLIWDVISGMKIGEGGYAYVIDRNGRLIAHPDISLVLRDTDLTDLPQVAAARAEAQADQIAPAAMVAKNINGEEVLTAHAPVVPLGWTVFVELPMKEALAPLYRSMMQSAALLALALVLAGLAALFLARRMVGPIRLLQAGAARIGAGELDRRIDIHTGDELEELAGEFNRMADDLQKSYADLEKKVEDRTAELKEALEQQTATAEVLGVINSSPGDLVPVFDAMLEKAMRLCQATGGALRSYDGDAFHAVAMRGMPTEFLEATRKVRPHPDSGLGRIERGEQVVQVADLTDTNHPRAGTESRRWMTELGGISTSLWVALRKEATLLGTFVLYRKEVSPFSDKEISLVQNFAAQAVIAIENARLLTETREALEQQTATAEVLQVINSSPGELTPVFEAILDKATRLCEADSGIFWTYQGENFRPAAYTGTTEAFAEFLRQNAGLKPSSRSLLAIEHGEPFVHNIDLAELNAGRTAPLGRAVVDLERARTGLLVPLLKDGTILGAIRILRRKVQPFSDKQIALLQNFAAQAVIAMENARLITETREALEQQTATAEVLQVINSSPGELTPVFDAMLDKAMRLCNAPLGLLLEFDGECFRTATLHGAPPAYVEFMTRGPIRPGPNTGLARLVATRRLVHIEDLAAEAAYREGDPLRKASVDLAGVRTFLAVPLTKESALLGAFVIYRQEVRPFSDKQIALLQNFAAQAVIAMENARLITETREALEQQTATAEVLGVINSSPGDLAPVFDKVLEKAVSLCEAAFGSMLLYNGKRFDTVAVRGVPAAFADYVKTDRPVHGLGTGPARILAGEQVVHIADLAAEEPYRAGDPQRRALVDLGGARSLVCVPLLTNDAVLGIIVVYRQEVRPFSEKQIALLQNFAAQAVIAMENARLLGELRQRTDDLQESLEYQTATSDVLKVVSRSAFDLDTVLQTVVTTAVRLCRADSATIYRNVDGEYRWAAGHMLLPDYEQIERNVRIRPGTGTLVGRAVSEARTVQILDAWTDPLYEVKEDARVGGVHTMIGVPLLREGVPIGVIGMARRRVEAFSEREAQLVTTFADQAVIAIENARLVSELRQRTHDLQESLEYQTATSDVLKVISQSTFDLQPVLTTLTETAARLCDAEMAFIFRRRGDLYHVSASVGFSPETKALVEANPISPGRGTVAGRTALTASVVHIPDARSDPEYTWGEFLRVARTPTMLGVPLLREGVPVGVIVLARQRMQPFGDKQIQLVRTFADQAVIAIENARLFNELRERTAELGRSVEELKMLSEVGQAVSSTLDLRTVLSAVLTASLGVTWANAGAIFRYSRAERAFRLAEAMGWDETLASSVREMRVAEAGSAMGDAAARRMPVQLPDIAQTATPLRDVTLAAGFRSALIIPLVGAERILGAIILMRQEAGEFPPETVRLMQTLASQSVLAIQNARMFREIADKSEQLALASQHKSQFLANMSHELRTPLNAILGYAELLVDGIYGALPERPRGVLERIQNNGKHLLALINDVLDLAKIEAGQLTLTLEDYSLPEVVKAVVTATEPLATSKGLKFTAALQDSLPTGHGDARRLSQVLLNLVGNAIKFTDEGEVEIRAALEKGQFVVAVRDTGPGIAEADQERIFGEFQQIDNSSTRQRGGTGLGLAISKRMVEMQGGTISVDSVLGQGSTFRVVLPVQVDEMMEEAA